ncbi:MAG: folate-binding protein YgfZ [Vicinamibacterales bacterium]
MEIVADYQALTDGAVLGALAPRGQIAVAGKDRAAYLQGLLTNDIQALGPGTGCYAAWLTPQGRLVTDMHVLESGEMILLDVPADLVESILQRLDQFLFAEDVRLGDLRGSLQGVWIHGGGAAAVLERALNESGLAGFADHQNARATFEGSPIVIARIDQLGVPGYCVYVEPGRAGALEAALQAAGAVMGTPETLEAARIEAGTPLFGVDMDTDTIPLEAGIEQQAISLTKGCYVGQEVIIRVLHRGHGRVAKKLVTLKMERRDFSPARGTKVFAGQREIGHVTSAAVSPRLGPIALAYLHRDFLEPGTRVDVGQPSVTATVADRLSTAKGAEGSEHAV